jgi:hypothetical protein
MAILIFCPRQCHFLDGGSLLYRVPWRCGETYGAIAKINADFTTKHYSSATSVFDGYEAHHPESLP